MNVVPSELAAYFDVRVNPWSDADEMDEQLWKWCRESGDGIQIEFLSSKRKKQTLTSVEPGNIWFETYFSRFFFPNLLCDFYIGGTHFLPDANPCNKF